MGNLSLPGNPRYQPKDLQPVFGYDNLFRTVAEVEIATMKTLAEIGVIAEADIASLTSAVEQELLTISTTDVDDVERKVTKHDIRAWVRIAQSKMDPILRRWIHVPLTSYDALDTARALQFVRGHEVVKRLTDKVIGHFIEEVNLFALQPQIGRTHGQHALPITVGFWFATILSRILTDIQSASSAADKLVGKISGAVGAYNAQIGLGFEKLAKLAINKEQGEEIGYTVPQTFEGLVLRRLGLKAAPISTQILPPEPLADYLFSCIKLSAVFGQFGLDGRNLMRTEIAELGEPFEKGQVGSSTMAHKRNPINFENLEGTWKKNKIEFGKVLECMTSEHQRDLVGSPIMRDFPTIVVNLVSQLNTLLREVGGKPFISRISLDEVALKRNFEAQGDTILAEPIYIALQMAGYNGDAHELVNHIAIPHSRQNGVSLLNATQWALQQESADQVWSNIPPETLFMLYRPESYTGAATAKAREVADSAEAYLKSQSTR
ncbi:MAG: Fumarate lyase [Microgenomates group bacterium GW2011_GWA1_Microgenomates_45_10]|nr:MAG: Fumarate lyase [Microgenomates group bacterium GW2011_GWA1_Microgenomates_45_10]